MATLALTDLQHCPLTITANDAAGNPAVLPAGAVTWTSATPTVVAVTPSADGMSADIAAVGPLGSSQIGVSVAVDANTTLTGTLDVTVTGSAAATIVIVPGTPVAK